MDDKEIFYYIVDKLRNELGGEFRTYEANNLYENVIKIKNQIMFIRKGDDYCDYYFDIVILANTIRLNVGLFTYDLDSDPVKTISIRCYFSDINKVAVIYCRKYYSNKKTDLEEIKALDIINYIKNDMVDLPSHPEKKEELIRKFKIIAIKNKINNEIYQ